MITAEDMRIKSGDNLPEHKLQEEIKRAENFMLERAKQGERTCILFIKYTYSEHIIKHLQDSGYGVKLHSNTQVKGAKITVNW